MHRELIVLKRGKAVYGASQGTLNKIIRIIQSKDINTYTKYITHIQNKNTQTKYIIQTQNKNIHTK